MKKITHKIQSDSSFEILQDQKIVALFNPLSLKSIESFLRDFYQYIDKCIHKGAKSFKMENPAMNRGCSVDYQMIKIQSFDLYGEFLDGTVLLTDDYL